MKTVLLHVPKLEDYYLPFGRYMNVNYMPMGVLGLAQHLRQNGHEVEVLHAGVEKILNPDWRIAEEVAGSDVQAIGLTLFWHYQSYDVAQAVRRIKEVRPDVFVFLGGITASYFAGDILETLPEADAVVMGEGFDSALTLLDGLERDLDLSAVPNLGWRREGEVVVNQDRLQHPQGLFDSLSFADFSPMRHHDIYIRQFGFPLAYSWERTPEENRQIMTMGRSFFPLYVGSGCNTACSYCCGNAGTLKRINGGHRLMWRSHDAVLRDVKLALDFGYRTMALCFDPIPGTSPYYAELFRRWKNETPEADLYFECWGLPEPDFVTAFADCFEPPHSYLALSPDSGSEAVRRKNKGNFYTNTQFFDCASRLKNLGIQMDVFFSIGFPGENTARALETRDMIRKVSEEYPNVRRLMTWAVQLEPGSLQFENPEHWGIVTNRKSFRDYVNLHGSRGDAYSILGYKIRDFFGDERDDGTIEEFEEHLQHFKCMEFCFLSKDPRVYNNPGMGRAECLQRRIAMAQRRGDQLPRAEVSAAYSCRQATGEERPGTPRVEI